MSAPEELRRQRIEQLRQLLEERIVLLDGAMGTMIQQQHLDEAGLRGERFRAHGRNLDGNIDLVTLTQPTIVAGMHRAYLEAGADIIETNTFNANSVSQADYGTVTLVPELNYRAAELARSAADEFSVSRGRPAFVAGALGPTTRLSFARTENLAGGRRVSFDELVASYAEAIRSLLSGGVDLLLIETVIDASNAGAAICAARAVFDETGVELPIVISATINDAGMLVSSGHGVEAFWNSVCGAKPLAVGLNCVQGGTQLRPWFEALSRVADTYICAYPNAGLPNESGAYDELPAQTVEILREYCAAGIVNIVGGCCGTTPQHIRLLREAVVHFRPRARK